MSLYKIEFSGFAFAEASSPDESMRKFWDGEEGFRELQIDSCEEEEE